MPPPTVLDSWLSGRHFAGPNLQLENPQSMTVEKGSVLSKSLPKVEKGTRDGEAWVHKVEPGISTYADSPETIAEHLRPLLAHARNLVPPSLAPTTPLFLLATAGMRLLSEEKQAQVLQAAIEEKSRAGPCGSSVRIITGEEEGLFGWIAVNYLMDGFLESQTTYGFLDMGGASTQIAFEPQPAHVDDQMALIDVRLRLLGGEEIHHKARERYVGQAINEHEQTRTEDGDDVSDHAKKNHTLVGTGSFRKMHAKTAPLLNNTAPCPDTPCLTNGVHYERAASKFCARPWASIETEHEEMRLRNHVLAGDGEVEKDGKVVEVGNYSNNVELSRLQMQCFRAAWIANVLHEGIGMPRIIDVGGTTRRTGRRSPNEAENKGLGRPTFQSVDTVGDIAISWTLGKMVLEASKGGSAPGEIRSPLQDPLDDPINSDSPIQPIRPSFIDFGAIEDKITPHLPKAFTRSSLGFSPVIFLFWCMLILFVILITYPLRRRLRGVCLRTIRDRKGVLLEEGKAMNGGSFSRPPSPTSGARRWFPPLRRLLSRRPASPGALNGSGNGFSSPTFPPPRSPIRSSSYSNTIPAPAFASASANSRSPSPAPFMDNDGSGILNGNGFGARSRNSSQKNLSVMVPRSRVPSGTGGDHY
ncbi:F-box domain-containing protein [Mycena venus]|uniref:F-box domain-containing protein n=1 Tax=Mycena venus TaxID=2733690 RepID=A0A8H6TY39_9AGAR|nr:F-box domain-containing protein [Mycena venus]